MAEFYTKEKEFTDKFSQFTSKYIILRCTIPQTFSQIIGLTISIQPNTVSVKFSKLEV